MTRIRALSRRKHWDGPALEAWDPWSPLQVSQILAEAPPSWSVVGGWALDLWLGRETRTHADIEVAIPEADFGHFRRLLEHRYALYAVGDGETLALEPSQPLPIGKHQCWIADRDSGKWRLDLMLEPGDRRVWVFRRDARIREPRQAMIGRSGTIPFLVPEGALLYKAKACRDKDEADFATVLPHLATKARSWLAASLALAHPGHPWIARLAAEERS